MFRMARWLAVGLIIFVASLLSAEGPKMDSVLAPLPQVAVAPNDNPTTPAKVELGKKLFFDPRLSGDNTISCASCHMPDNAYGDGLALSPGAGGKPLDRNTQTCLNVGFLTTFFWDGRASSLEEQALGPIQSSVEMNQDLRELEAELSAIPGYVAEFKEVFGTQPSSADTAKALAAFQRTLVTEPSPLDRYLAGDKNALSADARRGLELFRGEAGCLPSSACRSFCTTSPSITGSSPETYRLSEPTSCK